MWSDLYIESMRYGAKLTKDVMSLSDPNVHNTVTIHKEEGASRTLTDAIDREKIRNKLVTRIDLLNPANYSLSQPFQHNHWKYHLLQLRWMILFIWESS